MSIGPTGIMGSLAGGHLAQTQGSDTDRAKQETSNQARETKTAEKAELAAGIGQTTEDAETSERDADGRRLWEPGEEPHDDADNQGADQKGDDRTPQAKDPGGNCGVNLDLSG